MNNAQESEHRRRQASEASRAPQQSKTKPAKGTRGWEDGKKLNTTRALARIKRIATCICASVRLSFYASMHRCICVLLYNPRITRTAGIYLRAFHLRPQISLRLFYSSSYYFTPARPPEATGHITASSEQKTAPKPDTRLSIRLRARSLQYDKRIPHASGTR